jgi:chorismate mutase
MGGNKLYLREISQRAMDLGLDGLMVESHCDPSCALSDAKQQLTPAEFGKFLSSLVIRQSDTDSAEYKENMDQLRAQIDIIDENIMYILKSRMNISRKIGQYKKEHNIAILQTSRWDTVLSAMVEKGKESGLSENFVMAVFNAIHDESVKAQNEILSDKRPK